MFTVILVFSVVPAVLSSLKVEEKWCASVQASRHHFFRALFLIIFVEDRRGWIKMDF